MKNKNLVIATTVLFLVLSVQSSSIENKYNVVNNFLNLNLDSAKKVNNLENIKNKTIIKKSNEKWSLDNFKFKILFTKDILKRNYNNLHLTYKLVNEKNDLKYLE